MNTGVISDDYQVKVVGKGNRRLGEVEESFLGRAPTRRRVHHGRPVREGAAHAGQHGYCRTG